MNNFKKFTLATLMASALSACGGGGSGGEPTPTPQPTPKNSWQLTINGSSQTVKENDLLTVHAYICEASTNFPLDYSSRYTPPIGQGANTFVGGLTSNLIPLAVNIKAVSSNRYQIPETWMSIKGGNRIMISNELDQTIFTGTNHFKISQINGATQIELQAGSCPAP